MSTTEKALLELAEIDKIGLQAHIQKAQKTTIEIPARKGFTLDQVGVIHAANDADTTMAECLEREAKQRAEIHGQVAVATNAVAVRDSDGNLIGWTDAQKREMTERIADGTKHADRMAMKSPDEIRERINLLERLKSTASTDTKTILAAGINTLNWVLGK